MIVVSAFDYGGSAYVVYQAEKDSDEIPMHQHLDRGHLTVAMAGEIEVFFPDREPVSAKPGDAPFEFGVQRLHGVRALKAGTLFMSVTVRHLS